MATSLEAKIAQAEKANAILDKMDETGMDEVEVDTPKTPDGTIKIQLSDVIALDTFVPSSEMNKTMDEATSKGVEDAPKIEALSQGFMFQAGQAMAGQEPFYLTVNLVGQDQYAVSGNKNGLLSREDIKALRKQLKAVMNEEKEQFNVGKKKNPAAEIGPFDSMDESYYAEDEQDY